MNSEARLGKECCFLVYESSRSGIARTTWCPDWIGEADSVITKCNRSCHLCPFDYEEHDIITSPKVPVAKGISDAGCLDCIKTCLIIVAQCPELCCLSHSCVCWWGTVKTGGSCCWKRSRSKSYCSLQGGLNSSLEGCNCSCECCHVILFLIDD